MNHPGSYSQRTRFVPDELLPCFEPATELRFTLDFPQGDSEGDVCDVKPRP